ncbi:MAG: hypothetical protein ACRDI3_02640, partial [Actinomycetota bacterium]
MTRPSARDLTVGAGGVAALATLSTLVVPLTPLAFRNSSIHIAMDATGALVPALVAYLLVGRFRQGGRTGDLALIFALSLLSVTNLLLSVLPTDIRSGGGYFTWLAIVSALLGTMILALSAFIGIRPAKVDARAAVRAVIAAPALVVLTTVVLIPLASSLPFTVELDPKPGVTSRFSIEEHPVLLGVQLVSALMYVFAAMGFTKRAQRENDPLMKWLGAGAILAAFSHVNFFLYPALYATFVYTG